ncbi:T9SS type A sorting domain-containing protein [Halocola ammonii]
MKNRYSWRNAGRKVFSVMGALLMAVAFGGYTQAQTTCEITNMQGGIAAGSVGIWGQADQGMAVMFDPAGSGDAGDPGCFLEAPYTYTVDTIRLNLADASIFNGIDSAPGTFEYVVKIWEAVDGGDGCHTVGSELWTSGTLSQVMDDSGFYPTDLGISGGGLDVTGPFFVSLTTVSWDGDPTTAPSALLWDAVPNELCRSYVFTYNTEDPPALETTDFQNFFEGTTGWPNISIVGSYPEPVGDTDIAVNSVTAPAETQLGIASVVSAEIENLGDLNEQDVIVSLLEDGTEVATTAANIASGATATVEFNYVPTVLGEVELTAQVAVDGDVDTANDMATTNTTVVEPPNECAIEDEDFESFADGDYLAENSDNWATWSGGGAGTAEDVQISTAQANSGSNSVIVTGDATDALLLLGDATTGMWEVTKMMYVPTGSSAYWNLQGNATPGNVFVFECYMNADGTGEIVTDAGAVTEEFGDYPQGEWFEVRLTADVDQEVVNIYIDGTFVNQIQSADDMNLSAIDYYPAGGDGADEASRTYYVDDVSVCPFDNGGPCTAFALEFDATIEGDNTDAEIFDETVIGSCWTDDGADGDVWFEFTVPEDGDYGVTTDLEVLDNDDTQLAAYTGDCDGELTEIGCGDDVSSTNYLSTMNLEGLTAGTVVYIQVDGWDGTTGNFQIQVTMATEPLPNDECDGATDLSDLLGLEPGQSAYSDVSTNIGATVGENDEPGSCFDDESLEGNVWFTFEGDGETYFIETMDCEGTAEPHNDDTQIAIYEGSCGSLTEVACNEDIDFGAQNYLAGTTFATEEGVTYFMQVDGWGGTTGQFCISFTRETGIDENDAIDYSLYPNPTNGNVTLTASETIEGVRVLDMVGKVVKTVGIDAATQVEINMSDLPSGVYFVEVSAAGNQYVERLIKE